jgi:hypothetical protein
MKKGGGFSGHKIFLLLITSIFFVYIGVSFISATWGGNSINSPSTVVEGKVYYAMDGSPASGARLTIVCEDNNNIRRDSSREIECEEDGTYYAAFNSRFECDRRDFVTVTAEKDDLVGMNSKRVMSYSAKPIDIALGSSAPVVPEFGVIAGLITILGAVGVFFVVRKR